MKLSIFFSIFCFLFSTSAFSNFGLIYDKDGYVNLREEMDLNSKILERVNNNEVISCILEEEKSKFCYTNLSNGKQGYIYKNRVNFFNGYDKISLSNIAPNLAVFKGGNIEVRIFSKEVSINKKELKKNNDKYYLGENVVWGADNLIPNNNYLQLYKIEIIINGKVLMINSESLKGYFFPRKGLNKKNELSNFDIYLKNGELYLLNQFNSGGASSYNVYFYIKDGKLIKSKAWLEEI